MGMLLSVPMVLAGIAIIVVVLRRKPLSQDKASTPSPTPDAP
jgi:prolipoprotein diacylglyceryltransferase